METGVQSSFIPPDSVEPVVRRRSGRGSLFDFVSLVAVVIFVTSAALGVGVFLYEQFLETSKKSKIAELERAKASFEPALIKELTRLDDRMKVSETLLANHIAPSIFFRVLELVTLQTVSFRSLEYNAVDAQNISIKMDGLAESVNSVALQADVFSKNGVITSPIFSGIDRTDDGVKFSLEALVNPNAIRYTQFFATAPEEQAENAPADEEVSQPSSPFGRPADSVQPPQSEE